MNQSAMSNTNSFPRGAILDAWSDGQWDHGVQIDQMAELTTLAVRTQNTVYEITVLNGQTGEVLVRGGKFFPERTAVRLEGCTFGGSILKWRGIYVGMRMEIVSDPAEMVSETVVDPVTGRKEFLHGHKAIITSPVRTIGVL
jgi:hypothetical protein